MLLLLFDKEAAAEAPAAGFAPNALERPPPRLNALAAPLPLTPLDDEVSFGVSAPGNLTLLLT